MINKIRLLFIISCFIFSTFVNAARNEKQKATGAIDAKTFEKLMEAQELTEADKHTEALAVLDALKAKGKISGYGKSQMWNFYAFIYASKEDFNNAIDAYKEVIAIEETPAALALQAKYTIGQLYFHQEKFDLCIQYINEWLNEVEKATPTGHIMLAQAYYQLEKYDLALTNVDKAVELEVAAGRKVKENWLRLKSALYYDKGDYKKTAETYELLIKLYPKTNYLKQLAGMYGELGEEMRRLTVFDSIYLNGEMKKSGDILNLAYMFLGQEVPYKAAKIIEKGMNDGIIEKSQKNIETPDKAATIPAIVGIVARDTPPAIDFASPPPVMAKAVNTSIIPVTVPSSPNNGHKAIKVLMIGMFLFIFSWVSEISFSLIAWAFQDLCSERDVHCFSTLLKSCW